VLIHNLIKPRSEIIQAIADCGLIVHREEELDNAHSLVDDSYPYKSYVKKHAMMMLLQRDTLTMASNEK